MDYTVIIISRDQNDVEERGCATLTDVENVVVDTIRRMSGSYVSFTVRDNTKGENA